MKERVILTWESMEKWFGGLGLHRPRKLEELHGSARVQSRGAL